MSLQFVPKSHLFFTAGKDRKIKQWDADKWEHIQTLEVAPAPRPLGAGGLSAGLRQREPGWPASDTPAPGGVSLSRGTTRRYGAWL